jgi:putative tributyrin esterase
MKMILGTIMRARRGMAVFCWAPFLLPCILHSQVIEREVSFHAPNANAMKEYTILLPPRYAEGERLPVLYLLHGYRGNHRNWVTRTGLRTYVEQYDLIVVMPDGENSWYVNSAGSPSSRFEDYIVYDLARHVAAEFNADTTRQAIAGLSMGGYGAVMLAWRHPQRYMFAGSLSGALSVPREIGGRSLDEALGRLEQSLLHAFGDPDHPNRVDYDLFQLFRKTRVDSLPYTYFAIGTMDVFRSFLPRHRELTDSLRAYGAQYEYHENPGMHNWQYWNRELQPMLLRMKEIMGF